METAPGNERLEIEISTQQAEMQKVERKMRLMRERLPPDNQEALEMALAEVVGSQGAAFSRLLLLASEHHLHKFAIYKSFICTYIYICFMTVFMTIFSFPLKMMNIRSISLPGVVDASHV